MIGLFGLDDDDSVHALNGDGWAAFEAFFSETDGVPVIDGSGEVYVS